MMYRVSVVVPTYKRPQHLQQCLLALTAQDIAPCEYEVIIVDDAACEETRRQVQDWSAQNAGRGYTFRYLDMIGSRHGPAAARNCGWRAASGEVIAFTDDDCIPVHGWLRVGLSAFVEGVVGVSGKIIVPLDHIPTDYEHNTAMLATADFVTANCFYRRDALQRIGGFDERFTMAWREDSDLIFRLEYLFGPQGTEALVTAPQAVVVHPVRPAPWGVSLKQQRKSIFNALLFKKHPRLYRERIQAGPPAQYYLIVAALLAALGAALLQSWWLVGLAFALWLGLTARFCLLRLRSTSRAPGHVLEMCFTSLLIPPLAIFWRLVGALRFRVLFL